MKKNRNNRREGALERLEEQYKCIYNKTVR